MVSGKEVFVNQKGVQYLIDRYLSRSDMDELRRMNTEYSKDRFREQLVKRLEKGSGSRHWIPTNYEDELVENASAIIGTSRKSARLKNGKNVDVYETGRGREVYEDGKGRLRDYRTGRYIKRDVFDN